MNPWEQGQTCGLMHYRLSGHLLGLAAWTQEWDYLLLLYTTSFFAELDPNPFSLFFLSHGRALELCY